MGDSLRLGKILGIDIRLHYSWFIIFAVVTLFFYTDFRAVDYSVSVSLAMGLLGSFLMFASVVSHELAHSVVAVRNGVPVRSITLFILGGVANITKEAERPRAEMLMAIAGPLCSLVLGGLFGVLWVITGGLREDASRFHDLLFVLAQVNLVLAFFNLLPGFPLDGGRVFRAVLWQTTGNYRRATRIASIGGQIIGWVMIGAGIAIVIAYFFINDSPVDIFQGIWFAVVGWFLSSIAASGNRQAAWRESMKGITAASAMVSDFTTISPDMSLVQLIRDHIQPKRVRSFVVATEGRFQGVVNLEDVRRVSRNRWDMVTVGSVMTPAGRVTTIAPEEEAIGIAEKMEEYRLDGIPVVKDGVVIGLVTRNSLAHAMQMRAQFGTR